MLAGIPWNPPAPAQTAANVMDEHGERLIYMPTLVSRLDRLDVPSGDNATDTHVPSSNASAGQRPHSQQQSLASSLVNLTSLVDLNVARNKFDGHSADHSLGVFTKAGFPRLSNLDVRGTNLPAEEETRELLRISAVS